MTNYQMMCLSNDTKSLIKEVRKMNKKQMNEMISKQIAEQVAKSQKQNLIITGISVAGVGLISILANRKMSKKQQDQVEAIKEAVASRDEDYQEVLSTISENMANQDAERTQLLKDINENLKKQSEIFDRINFCFEQQNAFYEEQKEDSEQSESSETQEEN